MNILAFILALGAVVSFVAIMLGAVKAWLLPLGLALISTAFIVQLVFSAHTLVVN